MAEASLFHLYVEIELAEDDFADDAELDARDQLIDAIEERQIGEVGGFGSGAGGMDISVMVVDEQVGRELVSALIRELMPEAKYTIEVLPDEEDAEPA